jgi:hypothetical protein
MGVLFKIFNMYDFYTIILSAICTEDRQYTTFCRTGERLCEAKTRAELLSFVNIIFEYIFIIIFEQF